MVYPNPEPYVVRDGAGRASISMVGSTFRTIALFFITIGEGVFLLFSLLKRFFVFLFTEIFFILKTLVVEGYHVLTHFFFHKKRRHRTSSPSLILKLKYFGIGVAFSFLFLFLPLSVFALIQSLPNPGTLGAEQFPQTTKIYDRNHHLLYQIYATQNRTLVTLKDIPAYLQNATIAIEDKNFYKNPGFDIVAIVRAFIANLTGQNIQGGSTITQQLIKSALLTPDRSLQRKFQEIVLALWAQHLYSKQQILEMYFNQVPYGGTAWGVEAAAQTYFGKDVQNLDLAQSAFLAGLPQAPSIYSPLSNPGGPWKKRQLEVLARMKDLGFISASQEKDAAQEQLTFETPQIPLEAPHFVWYIKNLLTQKYGLPLVEKGGLTVITSLDVSMQKNVQKIVADEVGKDGYLNLSNGAAVVTNPKNGDILAMVGSADYNNPDWGNVNVATALRQPGSSIKIVTYAAALSKGYTSTTYIDDSPISFPGDPPYSPVNYDGRWHGKVTLRQALANSFNIPAVKTLNSIGIDTFVSTGRAMGIESLEDADQYGLSVTLGSADVTMLDMATAYGTLANEGGRVDLNPILKVTDYKGNVLEEKSNVTPQQVLDPKVAFILSDILADNQARSWEFGTNSPLKIDGHHVSVKTGTTDSKRDNWTIGYTPNYVVTVWVGNNDNSPMSQDLASGITGAAPIWHDIMTGLLQNKPDIVTPIPSGITSKECLGHTEYFVVGTENGVNCSSFYPTWTPIPTK